MNVLKVGRLTQKLESGDLFLSENGDVFLLTHKVCDWRHKVYDWRAWSLQDGNVWISNPETNTPEAAVKGLEFLGRNLKITIE